jgi:hypothetical protein
MNVEIQGLGSTNPGKFRGKLEAIQCILYQGWLHQPRYELARAEIPVEDGMAMNHWPPWYAMAYMALASPFLAEETVRGGWRVVACLGIKRPNFTKEPHRLNIVLRANADPNRKALVEVRFYHTDYATRYYHRKKAEKLAEEQIDQIERTNKGG